MTNISLQKLSEVLSGELKGNPDLFISDIITDSRSVVSSGKSVFFALIGERNNGHTYISDLYQRGIVNFVVSDYKASFDLLENANFILVEDTMNALHLLGKYHRDSFKEKVIAIIGSNGKTIVKEWLFQLLHEETEIVRSPKSFNSQLGVPLSLNLLDNNFQLAIIEAGISKPGEMEKLEKIIKPDVVIFTSFGEAHQENFENLETKAKEKLKMTKNAETIIYSPDDFIVRDLIISDDNYIDKPIFTWSYKTKDADLFVENINKKDHSSEILVRFKNRSFNYTIPFIDEASIKNSLSCISFLIVHKLLTESVLKRFAKLEQVEMRIEQKIAINNCILINDSYNSDLVSLKIAVDLIKHLSQTKKKTLILSDIMQSGMSDIELYGKVIDLISDYEIDRFIGIGEQIYAKKHLFNNSIKTEFYKTTEEFLKKDLRKKFNDEIVLLKGSRKFQFERISEVLELKKHRTVLEINMEALTHNLNYYKSLIPSESKIMVMVKAFSYGSGTHEIASLLQHHRVDYLGVAFADEGVELRKAGITSKIIVMNPDEEGISDIIEHKLEPEIYNFRIFDAILNHLKHFSRRKLSIHLKIDTGMNRLGFCPEDTGKLISLLEQEDTVIVKSIFSHLVAADDTNHDEFTKKQISEFDNISKKIINTVAYPIIRHISNTSGIERFPEATFDMVRVGIGLYGFSGNENGKLMNVSTLKTRITQVKDVKKGESVSYGRKWIAKRESKIAVIPIGYADGLNRRLSNEVGAVLVNTKKAPIVGNICMDMCMIDVTNLDVTEGDEVIIFGDEYRASEIAEKLDTIPYEIITGISERVKRVYIG